MHPKEIDILVISPTPTHPTNAGNRARFKNLLDNFDKLGLKWFLLVVVDDQEAIDEMSKAWKDRVKFISYGTQKRTLTSRITGRIRRLLGLQKPVESYKIDTWFQKSVYDDIQKHIRDFKPKGVWIGYVFMSKCFESFDAGPKKILDTIDVFANRASIYKERGLPPNWFYTTVEEEKKGCLRADYVLAIQDTEEKTFASYGCRTNVLGHFLDILPSKPPKTTVPTIVFIGSLYDANTDAITYFLESIFPSIKKRIPLARVEIYGEVSSLINFELPDDVVAFGRVDDLSVAYDNAWIVIAPIRMGTGLKIKSIEALARGRALVATPEAVKGMESGDGKAFLKAENSDEFAAHCIHLIENEEYRSGFETESIKFCQGWNAAQTNKLKEILSELDIL